MLRPGAAYAWGPMLRLLGFVFIVIVCVGTAPWGLLVGAILCVGWYLTRPEPLSKTHGLRSPDQNLRGVDRDSRFLSAIPLLNAVYCVNCDVITNSPHDACEVCGSHSVMAVERMWQLTFGETHTQAARYKISFTADIREIPANGLNESTKLISRLAELGGDVKVLHIQVDSVYSREAIADEAKIELLKPVARTGNVRQQVRQRAS